MICIILLYAAYLLVMASFFFPLLALLVSLFFFDIDGEYFDCLLSASSLCAHCARFCCGLVRSNMYSSTSSPAVLYIYSCMGVYMWLCPPECRELLLPTKATFNPLTSKSVRILTSVGNLLMEMLPRLVRAT